MIHNIEAQKKQEGKRNNEVDTLDTRLIVRFTKTLLLLPKLFFLHSVSHIYLFFPPDYENTFIQLNTWERKGG